MPKEIQNPRTSSGLTAALGLKGRFPLQCDEVVVGTVGVLDLEKSPYGAEAIPCGGRATQGAGGAGVFSSVGVRPGVGTILEVRSICCSEQGAITRVLLSYTDGTNYGLWTETSAVGLTNFNAPDSPAATNITVGSQLVTLTRNLIAGAAIWNVRLPAPDTQWCDLPYGFFLYGDSPLGRPCLLVQDETANKASPYISFLCREWRLPG